MTPINYITSHVMTRLKPSEVHGVGVFALRDIKKGEKVFEVWNGKTDGYYLSPDEYDTLTPELKEYLFDMFGIDNYVRLYDGFHFVFTTPQFFINTKGENGTVEYSNGRALVDINKGDELFSNYGPIEKNII